MRFTALKLSYLFLIWYTIGLLLMLFYEVPHFLQFSNGLFLVFYALSLTEIILLISDDRIEMVKRIAFVGLITFIIEVCGVRTGFPFGSYQYYATLGPRYWGVPITIAMAWVGVIVNSLLLSTQHSKWRRALETGMWVVVLDLILDPVAVERMFWVWDEKGSFYGIPVINFISWAIIAALLSLIFPLFQTNKRVLSWSNRSFEAMIGMFGLLAWKEGLEPLFFLALLFVLMIEGRFQFDSRKKKQVV